MKLIVALLHHPKPRKWIQIYSRPQWPEHINRKLFLKVVNAVPTCFPRTLCSWGKCIIISAFLTYGFGEQLHYVGWVSKEVIQCTVEAEVPGTDTEASLLGLSTDKFSGDYYSKSASKFIRWFCCLIFAIIIDLFLFSWYCYIETYLGEKNLTYCFYFLLLLLMFVFSFLGLNSGASPTG